MNNYEVLGLPAQATLHEAKAAYRLLSMREHPLHQATEQGRALARARFEAIARAFEEICARGNYDPTLDSAEIDERFEEAMHELASEKGLGELPMAQVVQAMVEMGCPHKVAQDVVESLAFEYDDAERKAGFAALVLPQQAVSLNQLPWAQAKAYYAAALQDGDSRNQISDNSYDRLSKIRDRWGLFWLGLGVAWLLVVLVGFLGGKAGPDTLSVTAVLLGIFWTLWLLTRHRFMGHGKAGFLREHRRRYYLRWCERMHGHLHTTAPGKRAQSLPLYSGFNGAAFTLGPLWLGYRRLSRAAWQAAVAYGGLAVALQLILGGRWADQLWLAWLLLSVSIGLNANRWYFRNLQQRIDVVLQSNFQSHAVSKLVEVDAVSYVGWIAPLLITLAGSWCAGVLYEEHQAGLAGWDGFVHTAKQMWATPGRAATEASKQ